MILGSLRSTRFESCLTHSLIFTSSALLGLGLSPAIAQDLEAAPDPVSEVLTQEQANLSRLTHPKPLKPAMEVEAGSFSTAGEGSVSGQKSILPVPEVPAIPATEVANRVPLQPPKPRNTQLGSPVLVATGSSDLGWEWLIPDQDDCRSRSTCYQISAITEERDRLAPLPGSSSQTAEALAQTPTETPVFLLPTTAINPPSLRFEGVYIYQGDQSSARARLTAIYPLSPQALFGATLDLTTGKAFTDSPQEGLAITELYFATSPADVPNLRFVVGQLDLTSYFDRNSFAKDGATQFFNPVFQTNPALATTGIASRPGFLINWSVNDNLEAKASVFSSARNLGNFALDGFAGEVGLRLGNVIVRGTYVTDRDAGVQDGFREIFQVVRGNGQVGLLSGDREESYGINAELFIPEIRMGIFGRYGRYTNVALGLSGDTFSGGISFLDLFTPRDRLGLAYGRSLSNASLRQQFGNPVPDVLEAFYDLPLLPNLRLGFTLQQLNGFSETIAGIRIRTEFDVTPRRALQ